MSNILGPTKDSNNVDTKKEWRLIREYGYKYREDEKQKKTAKIIRMKTEYN